MATLTFTGHGNSYCRVNGVSVTFPYELADGDLIAFGNNSDQDGSFTVNGTTSWDDIQTGDIAIAGILGSIPIIDESYHITYRVPATRLSVDLATLAGWDALSAGAHNITVVAKADGFKDSAPSAAVSVTKAASMPAKGDIITLDSKQYRVLKTEGTVAEVLAMYDATASQKFGSSQTYANSDLDTYCNTTFYNSLSSAMQNAIVTKTFQQDSWQWSGGSSAIANYAGVSGSGSNYTVSLMSSTFGATVSRKCYTLSCQDVIDYLGVTPSMTSDNTTLTSENVWKMFWNQITSPNNTYPWLRSACTEYTNQAFYVRARFGSLNNTNVDLTDVVRPAFQIDLSKISWSK